MQSFDQCLLDMVKAGKVTEEESMNHAANLRGAQTNDLGRSVGFRPGRILGF